MGAKGGVLLVALGLLAFGFFSRGCELRASHEDLEAEVVDLRSDVDDLRVQMEAASEEIRRLRVEAEELRYGLDDR